jgi:hypothetical protein
VLRSAVAALPDEFALVDPATSEIYRCRDRLVEGAVIDIIASRMPGGVFGPESSAWTGGGRVTWRQHEHRQSSRPSLPRGSWCQVRRGITDRVRARHCARMLAHLADSSYNTTRSVWRVRRPGETDGRRATS